MIEKPELYIQAFAEAGADMISVHEEATPHLDRALSMIREHGCQPGAVINPATPVSALSEVFGKVDHVLVMSVNPGFGGQKFIPGALGKIRELKRIREGYNHSFRIEVDGGVGPENVADLGSSRRRNSGCRNLHFSYPRCSRGRARNEANGRRSAGAKSLDGGVTRILAEFGCGLTRSLPIKD